MCATKSAKISVVSGPTRIQTTRWAVGSVPSGLSPHRSGTRIDSSPSIRAEPRSQQRRPGLQTRSARNYAPFPCPLRPDPSSRAGPQPPARRARMAWPPRYGRRRPAKARETRARASGRERRRHSVNMLRKGERNYTSQDGASAMNETRRNVGTARGAARTCASRLGLGRRLQLDAHKFVGGSACPFIRNLRGKRGR